MSFVKYRLKDVATDFGVAPKEVVEIISQYFEKPKSNTQVLTEEELNVVFDRLTANHQIASIEQVFAVQPAKPKEQPRPSLLSRKISLSSPRLSLSLLPRQITDPSSLRWSRSPQSPLSLNASVSAAWWIPLLSR
jgi:hypothetical protein